MRVICYVAVKRIFWLLNSSKALDLMSIYFCKIDIFSYVGKNRKNIKNEIVAM